MAQEQAELDVKHIAQQMKHLQYENQNRIAEIRAENMTQLKLAQEDHGLQELELLNDKRELRRLLREKDEMTELQIQQLKMEQSDELRLVYRHRCTKQYHDTYIGNNRLLHSRSLRFKWRESLLSAFHPTR